MHVVNHSRVQGKLAMCWHQWGVSSSEQLLRGHQVVTMCSPTAMNNDDVLSTRNVRALLQDPLEVRAHVATDEQLDGGAWREEEWIDDAINSEMR